MVIKLLTTWMSANNPIFSVFMQNTSFSEISYLNKKISDLAKMQSNFLCGEANQEKVGYFYASSLTEFVFPRLDKNEIKRGLNEKKFERFKRFQL